MLNHIIRLQAVLEIITNQTALAIDLNSAQQRQMRTAVYQNRLALDWHSCLLRKEVCVEN
ncbi:ENR1 protein, partial [Atrichornis clamosus]|nr:ENR1 protein [Atrichornis clamosus]